MDVTGSMRGVRSEGVSEGVQAFEKSTLSLNKDAVKGLRVLGQVLRSTWWEWTSGSAPLFWRWNGDEQMTAARDGMHIFVQLPLPRSRRNVKAPRFDMDT